MFLYEYFLSFLILILISILLALMFYKTEKKHCQKSLVSLINQHALNQRIPFDSKINYVLGLENLLRTK